MLFFLAPRRSFGDEPVNRGIDELDLLLQPAQGDKNATANEGARDSAAPTFLLGKHVAELLPPCHQGPDLAEVLVLDGPRCRLTTSAYRAIARASIRSVFARMPSARANALTWRGLTIATSSPAAAMSSRARVSKPPVASMTTNAFSYSASLAIDSARRVGDTQRGSAREDTNVEPVFADVDADKMAVFRYLLMDPAL